VNKDRRLEIDIRKYNSKAWDKEVLKKNPWTIPVSADLVAKARRGEWSVVLTPSKPVPRDWFPPLAGADVLCLASGGGQQGPVLAAAGAKVTVFDNSAAQLEQDRMVAERDALEISTVRGDMADLSAFNDETFDLIVHPCSNCFVADVRPVWREAFRVLRRGGSLLSGFLSGVNYIFDSEAMERGELIVVHSLPYSDMDAGEATLAKFVSRNEPLEFGHTLTDQIGGQLDAGFALRGLYEDVSPEDPLSRHIEPFIATRAVKL
jgi:SAM-dependent methyltransferase